MPVNDFRPGEQHPERWRQDLNPEAKAGQNRGAKGPHSEQGARTAYDFKDIHDRLRDMDDDILRGIPILPEGSRLEQGAVYFDLRDPAAGELKARGDMVAGPGQALVPKDAVDHYTWNWLIGVRNPERLGIASET
ncbi:MAG TPA: hypothetical protein VGL23_24990 [Chloroflexota bacterium]|jgi:hypothetical protein